MYKDNTNEFLNQSDCLKVIDIELSSLVIEKEKNQIDKDVILNKNDGISNLLFDGFFKVIFFLFFSKSKSAF